MGTIVDDIMTQSPIMIRETDTLEMAVQMMDRNKIKRLVVTGEDRKVRGVLGRSDLVKLFAMK